MTGKKSLALEYAKELEAEAAATRRCLERVPESLYGYKPHEKSMQMEYLVQLVADIPRWIRVIIEKGEIDFATYEQVQAKTTAEVVKHFDNALSGAIKALQNATEESLEGDFYLKRDGQELFHSPKIENIGSSINHMVHHRGQLTVYMRLNEIAIPSIYGPTADEPAF